MEYHNSEKWSIMTIKIAGLLKTVIFSALTIYNSSVCPQTNANLNQNRQKYMIYSNNVRKHKESSAVL